ncbi:MAG: GNAT family N-acetyltransferase [Gammaproteobacteria bacterium]
MTIPTPAIRPARASEASELSALALRSKASWGYDESFMRQCREELSCTAAEIVDERSIFMVAQRGATDLIAGFYALARLDAREWELDALFVEPELIGTGYGQALMVHAMRTAVRGGARRIIVQSDPHAEPFYLSTGARRIGERASGSVPGRMLPLLAIDLESAMPG